MNMLFRIRHLKILFSSLSIIILWILDQSLPLKSLSNWKNQCQEPVCTWECFVLFVLSLPASFIFRVLRSNATNPKDATFRHISNKYEQSAKAGTRKCTDVYQVWWWFGVYLSCRVQCVGWRYHFCWLALRLFVSWRARKQLRNIRNLIPFGGLIILSHTPKKSMIARACCI